MNIVESLTFDDVLLMPQYSDIKSRKEVNTKTQLTSTIYLNTPIVASNMDTVCESDMAIKMAQLGGIGFIHRYLTIEEQTQEVLKVKTHHDVTIRNPYCVMEGTTTMDAVGLMIENNVSSVLVVDENETFRGILPLKNVTFQEVENSMVEDYMISYENAVYATDNNSPEEIIDIMRDNKVGKVPILDNNYKIAGLVTRKDMFSEKSYPLATRDSLGRLRVGAAVGVNGDYMERVDYLVGVGVDVLVVDIAHGHSKNCMDAIKNIKSQYEIPVIAGNVATGLGAKELVEAGADGIKVGVGPGSICTTRIVTGHGVPQLSAIMDVCNSVIVPIIADGGIRKSGDIVKALAAGASTVMLGSLLAGTEESPGQFIHRNGSRYKMIRGMASFGAALGRNKRAGDDVSSATPEGVEGLVPYRGYAEEVVLQLMGGVRSGFSYSGAKTLIELWTKAQFTKITSSGLIESRHHDIDKY